jgi:HTH-type transcriptional regulator, quorum sensing regulator NprR
MKEDIMGGGIGLAIKKERIKQNLKQTYLSRGICSVSYLSKVENNMINPSKEIISLLLIRLNLNLEEQSNNEEDFMVSLFDLYREGILYRDKARVKEELKLYEVPKFQFFNNSNFSTFHLYIFRLKLIAGFANTEIEKNAQFLKSIEKKFNLKQLFIYKMNIGLYNYISGRYSDALLVFESLLKIEEQVSLDKWEKADFYNMLGTSYLKSREHFNAIRYSSKAITYFKDNHLFNRTIDCYIVSSIAQRNLCEYEKAEENLFMAQKLAKCINKSDYEGLIYHNVGSLYAAQGNPSMAVENYKYSFEYKKANLQLNNSLCTILCIIKEYAKLNVPSEVTKWCKIGMEIIIKDVKGKGTNYTNQTYQHHFDIYQARFSDEEDLDNKIKYAIKFFEKNNNLRYVQKYSIILGDYYFKKKKYKASSFYYQKSNVLLCKQKFIKSLEDF